MDSIADLSETRETPKRRGGEGITLSPYQNILRYYERLQSSYGWTMQEVDAHEIAFLLDQLLAITQTEEDGKKFIDDVM